MMELRENYCFIDSLPFFDREYDHPLVKDAVQALIKNELTINRNNAHENIAYLPYPTLKYCHNKYNEKGIDMLRYQIESPDPSLINDVQYSRKLCNNIKIQHEYFNNRLENLSMMSEKVNASTIWLENNEYIQGSNEVIINKINGIKRKINEINSERYNHQSRSFDEIQRLQIKKAQSIQRIQLLSSYMEGKNVAAE